MRVTHTPSAELGWKIRSVCVGTHRAVTQLRNQFNDRSGLLEETFAQMFGAGIEELGLKVSSVVDELKK